jgi:sulfite oxidase
MSNPLPPASDSLTDTPADTAVGTATDAAPTDMTEQGAPPLPTRSLPRWAGVVAGVAAAGLALAVGTLVAAITEVVTPLDAVGSEFIDRTPPWLKQWAIDVFGTDDKLALRVGMWIVVAGLAAVIGALAVRRRWVGPVGIALFGVVGAFVAAGRPGTAAGGAAAVPPLLGALVGCVVVLRLVAPRPIEMPGPSRVPLGWDRRRFFAAAGATVAAAGAAGGIAQAMEHARVRRLEDDAATPLPALPGGDTMAAPATPAGAQLDPNTPFITPNDDFYRIDTALSFPRIDVDRWSFSIDGMVDRPLEVTYADLLAMPQVERTITLCCVSNEVGGGYIGNAVWRGVLLADLLAEAGVQSDAQQVFSTSLDGWTCGFPVAAAFDGRDAMVAVGMNGSALPLPHGYPARLVVPGLYGYVSATKWLARIELTSWEREGYWVPRGWAQQAPIKTQSRIGYPRNGVTITAGANKIAGVAWAQHRGIERVEVRVGDGAWTEATLATDVSDDCWRQWVLDWDAPVGEHTIAVRATDKLGDTQTDERSSPAPDGATGHHTIKLKVR